jgi:hypothetical protein
MIDDTPPDFDLDSIRYSDIDAEIVRLMRFLKDPETAWAVFETFDAMMDPAFPDTLREMFAKYQEYVGKNSPEDNFEFPEEWLAAWIEAGEADQEVD